MSRSSRPWGVTDRMTRALESLDDLDDALRQVVSGYLVDPSDSPTPTIGDRLALVRSAQDALPSAPDLILVLTALSVDRAQAVRRAAAQALGGGGGGKDDLAQGGGQNPEALGEALSAVADQIKA